MRQVQVGRSLRVAVVAVVCIFVAHALALWFARSSAALSTSVGDALLAAEATVAAICLMWCSQRKAAAGALPRVARGWAILAAAFFCFALGNVYKVINASVLHGQVFPSLADPAFLLFYALFCVGLFLLPENPLKRREMPRVFLDMSLVVLAVALTYWFFVVGAGGLTALADPRALLLLAYALLGLMAVYAATAGLLRQAATSSRWVLAGLAASVVLIMACDTVNNYQHMQGAEPPAVFLDLFYVAGVLAAFVAGMAQASIAGEAAAGRDARGGAEPPRSERLSLGLTYALLMLAWVFLIWRRPADTQLGSLTQLAAAGGMIAVLAMVRQIMLWNDNIHLTSLLQREEEALIQAKGDLEVKVQERTAQLVRVNDELRAEAEELARAQKALRESEALYRQLVETSPDGIALADLSGTIVVCNENLAQLAGYERARDLIGRNVFDLMVGRRRHDVTTYARRILVQGSIRDVEIMVTKQDGTLCYTSLNASLVSNEQGRPAAVIGVLRDVTERKHVEDNLRHLSSHDALTGAYNRTFFEDELKRLQASGEFPVSILVLDVDRFKRTNDILGHAAGDQTLRRTVALMRRTFRAKDVVARIGGDEFAVLLENAGVAAAEAAVRRMRDNLVVSNLAHDKLPLGLSIGAATALKGGTLVAALRRADARMYEDKLAHGVASGRRAGLSQGGEADD